MTNSADRRPFSMPYVGHSAVLTAITATSGAMVARAPWPSPVNKYFVLRKLVVTVNAANLTSGGTMPVWDQDVSNSTPVSRGSAGGPLLVVPLVPSVPLSGITQASLAVLDIDACPQEMFQAGITVAPNVSGCTVSFEADVV